MSVNRVKRLAEHVDARTRVHPDHQSREQRHNGHDDREGFS